MGSVLRTADVFIVAKASSLLHALTVQVGAIKLEIIVGVPVYELPTRID